MFLVLHRPCGRPGEGADSKAGRGSEFQVESWGFWRRAGCRGACATARCNWAGWAADEARAERSGTLPRTASGNLEIPVTGASGRHSENITGWCGLGFGESQPTRQQVSPRKQDPPRHRERAPVKKNAFVRALLGLAVITLGVACGGGGGGGGAVGDSGNGGTGPQTPSYFGVTAQPLFGVSLYWQPTGTPLPGQTYRIYRKDPNQSTFSLLREIAVTTHYDLQVYAGASYQYFVKSFANGIESTPTSTVAATAIQNGIGIRDSSFTRIEGPREATYNIRVAPDNTSGYYVLHTSGTQGQLAFINNWHEETSRVAINGVLAVYELPDSRSLVISTAGLQVASQSTNPGALSSVVGWPALGMSTGFKALIGGHQADPIVVTQGGSARLTAQGTFANYRSGGAPSSSILCGDAAGAFAHRVDLISFAECSIRRWTDAAGWASTTVPLPSTLASNSGANLCGTIQLTDGRIAVIGVEKRSPTFQDLVCYFVSATNAVSSPVWLDDFGSADTQSFRNRFRFHTSSARGWRSTSDFDHDISVMRPSDSEAEIAWRKSYTTGSNRPDDLVICRLPVGSTSWSTAHRMVADNYGATSGMAACKSDSGGYMVCWGPSFSYSSIPMTFRRWQIFASGTLDIQHAEGLPDSTYYDGVIGWIRPSSAMAVGVVTSSSWVAGHKALDGARIGWRPSGGTTPTAAFTATPLSGGVPLTVQFSDSSTGFPTSWSWDFNNDGVIDSTQRNPSWTYTTSGYKSVRLQVSNGSNSAWFTRPDYIQAGVPNAALNMLAVSPGSYRRGSTLSGCSWTNEDPPHQVTLSYPFWMSKYEVTQAQYLALMGTNPSFYASGSLQKPVENVSFNNAVAYCAALNAAEQAAGRLPYGYVYRLPTEAEWEYCCRAGTTTEWHTGSTLPSGSENFNRWMGMPGYPNGLPAAVGSFQANPWGFHDMHGNVQEWALDANSWTYPSTPVTNPFVSTGDGRVSRGGYYEGSANCCRSSVRDWHPDPNARYFYIGFRVALGPVYN